MRLLVVVPTLGADGVSRYMLDLAQAFGRSGVEVELFALMNLELEAVPHRSVPDVAVTSGRLTNARRHRYRVLPMSARLVRAARRADVVVAGWEVGQPLVAAVRAAKLAGRPVAAMVGSYAPAEIDHYLSGWLNAASKRAYLRLDLVVCAADGLVPVVEGLGVERRRIRVVGLGVDPARVRRLAEEPPPDSLPKRPYVVGLGRLARHKGFDLLIRAHAAVKAQGLDHELVVMGEGEDRPALENLIHELGAEGSVQLTGYRQNPFPVVAGAHLLCAPSRFEGWGLMLAEAVCLGVPVIATRLAGPEAVLDGGRLGTLVAPESVDDLTRAIAGHLRDPAPLQAKARLAREEAAERFSIARRVEQYTAAFGELRPTAAQRRIRSA